MCWCWPVRWDDLALASAQRRNLWESPCAQKCFPRGIQRQRPKACEHSLNWSLHTWVEFARAFMIHQVPKFWWCWSIRVFALLHSDNLWIPANMSAAVNCQWTSQTERGLWGVLRCKQPERGVKYDGQVELCFPTCLWILFLADWPPRNQRDLSELRLAEEQRFMVFPA